MKISARHFISAASQVAQAQLAGEIAGQQEQQRRQLFRQQQEQQEDTMLGQLLPHLDKASQDKTMGYLFNRARNRSQGLPSGQGLGPNIEFGGGMFRPSLPPQVPPQGPPQAQPPVTAAAPGVSPPLAPAAAQPEAPSFPTAALLGVTGPGAVPPPGVRASFIPRVSQPQPIAFPTPALAPAPAVGPVQQPVGQMAAPPAAPAPTPQAPAVRSAAAAPTPQQPAPRRRGINVPGLGFLAFRGVEQRDIDAVSKERDAALKQLTNAYSTDARQMENVRALASGFPTKIETEEDLAKARDVVRQLQGNALYAGATAGRLGLSDDTQEAKALGSDISQLASVGDPAALAEAMPRIWQRAQGLLKRGRVEPPAIILSQRKNFEAMQKAQEAGDAEQAGRIAQMIAGEFASPLKPAERRARIDTALKLVGSMSPEYVAKHPEAVKQVFEQQGVGYALEGLGPGALNFAGDELEKRWGKMTSMLAGGKLANLGEGARQQWFNEYAGLARLTGRKLDLTPADLAKLGPREQVKVWRDRQLFNWRGKEHEFKMLRARVDLERSKIGLEKALAEKARGFRPVGGKTDTAELRKAQTLLGVAERAKGAYEKLLKSSYLDVQGFDPDTADVNDPRQKSAKAAYDRWQQLQQNAYTQMRRAGYQPDVLMRLGDEGAAGGAGGAAYPSGKAGAGGMMKDLAAGKHLQKPAATPKLKPPSKMSVEEMLQELAGRAKGR